MEFQAKWIRPSVDMGEVVPVFIRDFSCQREIAKALLHITALGVYHAEINGSVVSDYILAPGWTSYEERLQYQSYDVTELLEERNIFEVCVAKGWYRSRLVGWQVSERQERLRKNPAGLFLELEICYKDGSEDRILSDESWQVSESSTRFSEIYDGEVYDASFVSSENYAVCVFEGPDHTLIPQQGEKITAHERIMPTQIFVTPEGDTVVDFEQEITGYVEISLSAKNGEMVDLSFAEVMDQAGNFYNENYRSAKCQYHYICKEGEQMWHPSFTFYGFRYVRINAFPGGVSHAKPENFCAVAVYSDLRQTGFAESSDFLLNRFFSNCQWGQKGNFLDIPTDCPQRDERLGWTGDAQVFVKSAALLFDVERFFKKWLADLVCDQHRDGYVGHVIPDLLQEPKGSAAWGDAAVICPWEIYLAYGSREILENQFSSMKGWVDYITNETTRYGLWIGGEHYGDWLGLDAPSGSYKGRSREDFIASAFYAYSTSLVIKAGHILGQDVAFYEKLYKDIVTEFSRTFPECRTQTEYTLALHFHLSKNPEKDAARLAELIRADGTKLQTGFVGTPYVLHALSDYGYADLAYELLLRTEYPSWLYPVTMGATTVWEHWDGIMEGGDFWSADMNSYNHYAYGSVMDWVYTKAAGIQTVEACPGYGKVRIAPLPCDRIKWLSVKLDTRHGRIESRWIREEGQLRYEIVTPVESEICIAGKTYMRPAGKYIFYETIHK